VRTSTHIPKRRGILPLTGLSLIVALTDGCGDSSSVQALPEATTKALIKRKVDTLERTPRTERTSQPPQERARSQKP
jgi:hypothetical protein